MAELHIDTDWKKQAQEEKKRLAEEQAKREAEAAAAAASKPAAPAVPPGVAPVGPAAGTPDRAGRGGQRAEASFGTLVQSQMTQAMFYLGELVAPGQAPVLNLDMAKHHLDMLHVLEEKTVNNLTEDKQRLLDHALYDLRTRFVAVASQYL